MGMIHIRTTGSFPSRYIEFGIEPQITVWPECNRCHMAYVYRRRLDLVQGGWEWVWQPGCLRDKCRRSSTPVLVKGEP